MVTKSKKFQNVHATNLVEALREGILKRSQPETDFRAFHFFRMDELPVNTYLSDDASVRFVKTSGYGQRGGLYLKNGSIQFISEAADNYGAFKTRYGYVMGNICWAPRSADQQLFGAEAFTGLWFELTDLVWRAFSAPADPVYGNTVPAPFVQNLGWDADYSTLIDGYATWFGIWRYPRIAFFNIDRASPAKVPKNVYVWVETNDAPLHWRIRNNDPDNELYVEWMDFVTVNNLEGWQPPPLKVWDDEAIGLGGAQSRAVPGTPYTQKTFTILSDQNGTLNIEADPDGSGAFYDMDGSLAGIVVTANQLCTVQTLRDEWHYRFDFTPTVQATVNAWATLVR